MVNFVDDRAPVIPNLSNGTDFEWAPLLDGNVKAEGVMAINATKFLPFIRSKFEPVLQNLVKKEYPYVQAGASDFQIKWKSDNESKPQKFTIDDANPWYARWDYTSIHNQDWQLVWAVPGSFRKN